MPTFDGELVAPGLLGLAEWSVMCVAVVQGFFAYRAFLLMKRNWFVLGLIWVSAGTQHLGVAYTRH